MVSIVTQSDLSPQAYSFLRSLVLDTEPTDFSRIESIRNDLKAAQSAAAERAVLKYQLMRDSVSIAGVPCERIVSKAKRSGGTMVYLFGGGFVSGCPHSELPIIGPLASQCGVEVIAPCYRLAPEHPAPAAADDCLAVWQQLATSVSGPLTLAGESAGGNLAVVIAQQAARRKQRLPDAMALLSPAVDLRTDLSLLEPTTHADPTMHASRLAEICSVYAPGRNLTDPALSPLFGSFDGFPPTMITTGTRDLLLSMCLRLHRQMIRAGVQVQCRVWDGLWHVFEYYDQYPEAAESLAEIAAFLVDHAHSSR